MVTRAHELRNVRAVLFDAVGTLFRSRGTVGEIYSDVARAHGVAADPLRLEVAFQRRMRESAPTDKAGWRAVVAAVFDRLAAFPDFEAFFEDVYAVFRSSRGWRCYPETVPVLETLQSRGYRLGIVSNFDRRLADVLEDLGIDRYFSSVVIPESSGYAKPDPRIFQTATEGIGVTPEEALFAGDDRLQDYEAAIEAGLHAVWIVRNGPTGPDRIRDLTELPRLLAGRPSPR